MYSTKVLTLLFSRYIEIRCSVWRGGVVTQPAEPYSNKSLGTVWVDCSYPVVALGLIEALRGAAQVHLGATPPPEVSLSTVVHCANGEDGLGAEIGRLRALAPDVPLLVFGLQGNLSLVRIALRAGARGFIHARMQPSQIIRAISVTSEGEVAVPRELLKDLVAGDEPVGTATLSSRQREVLDLVCEGLTNAQIARHLYLSEFTIKQHLRLAYKLLGVHNRTEAARVLQNSTS